MRILLIGEFSGVHNNLRKGLEVLGHRVVLANNGDSFKKFKQDFMIYPFKGRYIAKLLNVISFFWNIKRCIGYDIVQFISPFTFPFYYYYFGIPQLVFALNKKSVYYACGTDPAFLSVADKLSYFPLDDISSKEYPDYTRRHKNQIYAYFIRKVDLIVPAMYEYSLGYADSPKLGKPIPLPGSGSYKEIVNRPGKPVKILFGITRYDFKGTKFILEAIEKIRSAFEDMVEISVIEKLPFNKYIEVLKKTDILIDQCKSYSYGMNAIFAMENGVIVLSGGENEAINFLGIQKTPVFNLIPDVNQIVAVLSKLLSENAEELETIKGESLNFARKYHDPLIVGGLFSKNFQNLLN